MARKRIHYGGWLLFARSGLSEGVESLDLVLKNLFILVYWVVAINTIDFVDFLGMS